MVLVPKVLGKDFVASELWYLEICSVEINVINKCHQLARDLASINLDDGKMEVIITKLKKSYKHSSLV